MLPEGTRGVSCGFWGSVSTGSRLLTVDAPLAEGAEVGDKSILGLPTVSMLAQKGHERYDR